MKAILLTTLALLPLLASGQKDKPECADKTYSFFTRMEGFYISNCEESEFGQYGFWIKSNSEQVVKQGRYRKIWFEKDPASTRKVSGLQILANHENAIKKMGGVTLEGSDKVFRASHQGKEIWFEVSPNASNPDQTNWYILTVEVEKMIQEISAVDIGKAMKTDGKVALYGILFDTGKSTITSQSAKAISELAAFLKSNPTISIFVVGHTDNVGDYQANVTLSKSRAEAVKNELTGKFGIEASRLTAEGVGPLSPVGPNDTENSRKLNRRVEIVKR